MEIPSIISLGNFVVQNDLKIAVLFGKQDFKEMVGDFKIYKALIVLG